MLDPLERLKIPFWATSEVVGSVPDPRRQKDTERVDVLDLSAVRECECECVNADVNTVHLALVCISLACLLKAKLKPRVLSELKRLLNLETVIKRTNEAEEARV